jgi:hypothetical protein
MAKRTNNDLQNTTQKTKDRASNTNHTKTEGAPQGLTVPAPLVTPVVYVNFDEIRSRNKKSRPIRGIWYGR